MILLDTHVWIWWINKSKDLSKLSNRTILLEQEPNLGISIISCWEVAKLVERKRLQLTLSAEQWIYKALNDPRIRLLDLSPRITIESTQLPGSFHRDPADQLIVATARVLEIPLITADQKILDYPHVDTLTRN